MNAIVKPQTMNPELSTFNFGKLQVRVVIKDGEPWFVVRDVLDVLDIGTTTHAVRPLDRNEKRVSDTCLGRGRKPILISESGLYKLIMRSDKPEAKRFQNWVTQEVLPSIRKTGSYTAPGIAPQVRETEPVKPSYTEHQSTTQMFGMMGQLVDKLIHEKVSDVFEASLKESDAAFEELTTEYKGHVQKLRQEIKELRDYIENGQVVGKLVPPREEKVLSLPSLSPREDEDFTTVKKFLRTCPVGYSRSFKQLLGKEAVAFCERNDITFKKVIEEDQFKKRTVGSYPRYVLEAVMEQLGQPRF